MRLWLICFIISFDLNSFSQKLKINTMYAIDSPRIRVDSTTLNEVIALYGKDYKEIKILANHYCIEYANGLSFEYQPWDEKKLVRAILIRLPMKAVDVNGIEIGKSRVKDVLDLPLAYTKIGNVRAMVHTPYMNYIFQPDWKFKDGLDSNALIIGFYRYYGTYLWLPHYTSYTELPCRKVKELGKKFQHLTDSVMINMYGKGLFTSFIKSSEESTEAITEEGHIAHFEECVAPEHVARYELFYYFDFPGGLSDTRHYWQFAVDHHGKILEGGKKLWVFKEDNRKIRPACQQINAEKIKSIVEKKFARPLSHCTVIPYEDNYVEDENENFRDIDTTHFFLEICHYNWIKEAKNIGDKYKYTTKNLIIDACTYEVIKYWEEKKEGTRNRPGHF